MVSGARQTVNQALRSSSPAATSGPAAAVSRFLDRERLLLAER